jgi:RNA polymerase sigma factor for flagellar operon FliA
MIDWFPMFIPAEPNSIGARECAVIEHTRLVKYMALRIARSTDLRDKALSLGDLFSAGIVGLIDAVDKYDANVGLPFGSYARIRIRGSMLDEIRSMERIPRRLKEKDNKLEKASASLVQRLGRCPTDEEIASELRVSLDDYFKIIADVSGVRFELEDVSGLMADLPAAQSGDPFHETYLMELKKHIAEAIKALPENQQRVLSMYYFEELTMKEIGAVIGCTESRVSQIRTEALSKMKTKLSRKFKKDDV